MEKRNSILDEKQFEQDTSSEEMNLKQYFMRGLTSFLVIFTCIVCFFAFLRIDDITKFLGKVGGILQPIIIGLVFAYLLNPLVMRIEQFVLPVLNRHFGNKKKNRHFARTIGITISLLLTFAVVVLLLNMVIPELYESIRDLVISLPTQVREAIDYLEQQMFHETIFSGTMKTIIENIANAFETWLSTDLMRQVNQMMTSLTSGVISVVETLFHIAIGVIVSIYVLMSKERFIGQSKKITYALFNQDRANLILKITRKSNEIFGGFVIGKIIDSIIIGIICFVVLGILDMPYTLLVSVIVGVTNVIPFFGPFIGAIPSTILILLADPLKGLYFIIFILLLQQFDGNILGPKILGDSTGLGAFWVVFSILLGGGLFGFLGMVMGVPTFAVIYYLVNMFLEQRLEKKKLPKASGNFETVDYIDENGIKQKEE